MPQHRLAATQACHNTSLPQHELAAGPSSSIAALCIQTFMCVHRCWCSFTGTLIRLKRWQVWFRQRSCHLCHHSMLASQTDRQQQPTPTLAAGLVTQPFTRIRPAGVAPVAAWRGRQFPRRGQRQDSTGPGLPERVCRYCAQPPGWWGRLLPSRQPCGVPPHAGLPSWVPRNSGGAGLAVTHRVWAGAGVVAPSCRGMRFDRGTSIVSPVRLGCVPGVWAVPTCSRQD